MPASKSSGRRWPIQFASLAMPYSSNGAALGLISGKVSAGVSEEVSAGVCGAGFKPVHFAQPANAKQPSNIRAARGISIFSPQVPELISFSSTSSVIKKQFEAETFNFGLSLDHLDQI